jgi:hypothetical protein
MKLKTNMAEIRQSTSLSFQKGKYVKVVLLYFVCVYLTGVVGLH